MPVVQPARRRPHRKSFVGQPRKGLGAGGNHDAPRRIHFSLQRDKIGSLEKAVDFKALLVERALPGTTRKWTIRRTWTIPALFKSWSRAKEEKVFSTLPPSHQTTLDSPCRRCQSADLMCSRAKRHMSRAFPISIRDSDYFFSTCFPNASC